MNKTSCRLGGFAVAILTCAGIATGALAQTPGSAPPEAQGQATGPGYGMMGGYGGMGPGMMGGYGGQGYGMMNGWGGQGSGSGQWSGPKVSIEDRLAALKDQLNITAGETDAWNTYTAAVTAAEQGFLDGMKALWQPAANGTMTQDQRFDAMNKMIALMKQGYDQKKAAADALMPHLTPYQQGQASEILPGLATKRGGRGWGMMGGGMMGQSGW